METFTSARVTKLPTAIGLCMSRQVSVRSLLSVWRSHRSRLSGWGKNKTAFSIFRQVCTIVSHKTGVTMTGSCFCIGIHSRAVRGRTEEWGGYRGEKKWCTFHLYYVRDFYSARPLCWERPTRGSFYSHDSSFASIICFPLQIAALQVGCLL